MKRLSIVIFAALLFCGATVAYSNDVVVENPTYPDGNGPVIAVDGGHNNFHSLDGGFKVFGELAGKDGYNVKPIAEAFTEESLADVDILVTATAMDAKNAAITEPEKNGWVLAFNPLAPPNLVNGLYPQSAYTDAEIAVIKKWVEKGGSLMLVTDHMPFPASQQALAKAFGIILDNTFGLDEKFLIYMATQGQAGGNPKNLFKFYKDSEDKTDANGMLYPHKITEGIHHLTSFTGSSFHILSSVNYQPLMEMGQGVLLVYPYNHVSYPPLMMENKLSLPLGQGLLQGATLFYGKGRVAVFAEAAMFSSSVTNPENGIFNPAAEFNQAFALNTLGWLAEKPKPRCIDLNLENGIDFTVPNLNISGLKFAAKFKYDKDLNFKMEKNALTDADTTAQEIGLNTKTLTIPCIKIDGRFYTVTFTCPTGNFVDWEYKDHVENEN
ncbi:MAG: hypothetical protein HQK65_09805 [Desulfamplus sp.]|nr:hypothetical protein [Desulfamplus sp.]